MAIYNNTKEIIDRIEELEYEIECSAEADNIDLLDEFNMLVDAIDEIGNEAKYGIPLIHEINMADYAKELWEETTGHNENEWPYRHIAWDDAANELAMDYTTVEIDGETYYYSA